jgi:hypothetical protein
VSDNGPNDGEYKLCTSPCIANPNFLYYSSTSKLCYESEKLANAGGNDCKTLCTLEDSESKECVEDNWKCSNLCHNRDFHYYSSN